MPASPEAADTPTDAAPLSIGSFSVLPRPALLADEPAREFERGAASWYGPGFHGRLTASGERYDMNAFTAAHRTLPFGTLVRVHSLVNGRDVDLRITDRGPFSRNRIIDVSRAAAAELGMLGLGFKEVVLLVPESTPAMATAPRSPVKKSRRSAGRTPVPKVR
ncbi:MAG: septal ring lytic transglycosylase RlpA family protein [Polaromonas sp.]|nr:septal ring lytic transglycosylase RlpA family protein [Polaromonas sp.]